MKILITGHSKWIWKYLSSDLEKNHEVFWFSGSNWFDLRKKEIFQKIKENIWEDVLDVLILNAWIWEFWNFEDIDLNNLEDIINLNLLANIRLLKTLQYNIKKETKIIFVWSIISKKFMKWASVYQASKFWLRWLAWWLKNEWKKVFLINPKIVNTDFHKWKIELDKRFTETKLEDILNTVENIINWNEKRFEIDL
jgi:short-subunit dehydrogenase